jgi:hypothetical protein
MGSWEEFARAAGLHLHPSYKTPIPSEELFEEFFRLRSKLAHPPTCVELLHARYSAGTFAKRFKTCSRFKVNAIQYGIDHGLIEPDVARKELLKPVLQPRETGRHEPLRDRPVLGERIDFRGLLRAPVNELGVVYLFGIVAQDLGFVVESVQSGFPDCEAKRRLSKDRWQTVRLEFEFLSSNFLSHGHDLARCDVIVCWEHDWTDCPIEVVALKDTVARMKGYPGASSQGATF